LAEEENKKRRVIRSDCRRTRANVFNEEEIRILEWILTCYCEKQGITYKQGMNEILAPFLILSRKGLSPDDVYSYFTRFIEKLLPSVFKDDVTKT
jgi:hypothetical protein